ncbi:MAG: hypothetical protein P8099_20055 [Gemmatimonadota bacterium]|jgi:hypothetical protein
MPSDERIDRASEALAGVQGAFHSAVATAADQIRVYLENHRAPANGRAKQVATELGAFASGRIDPDRFSSMFAETDAPDAETLTRLEAAADVLTSIAASPAGFRVEVEPGGDLRDAVAKALAEAGRAFGAARVVEFARAGRYDPATHDDFLSTFPARMWNRPEREIAPPLVVAVDGKDLRTGGLAEFLDGAQKIVLVVHGAAPPAPLVRLITPGVFVMQTADAADLAKLAAFSGPGIAALVGEESARFIHDPKAGRTPEARLNVLGLPTEPPAKPIGRLTVFQQTQELEQLRALSAVQAPAEGEVPEKSAMTMPGDKLAAWLIRQANLS